VDYRMNFILTNIIERSHL